MVGATMPLMQPSPHTTTRASATQALNSWREEKNSAYLYRQLAKVEMEPVARQLFAQLAQEADSQAVSWADLVKQQQALPLFKPLMRIRLLAGLVRVLGVRLTQHMLAASKVRGLSVYAQRLPSLPEPGHAMPTSVEQVGARHRGIGTSGGLRAAVFGVNDGLVSIACLVMGVAGAAASQATILMTGIAGLLAGAFSMAAGEYISMRSQREMFEYQISLERVELAQYPQQEARELALIYMARGLQPAEAEALAQRMIADPELGLDTLAREELGLNPDELGSPWTAAVASLLSFAAGGLIPLLPFLLGGAGQALPWAMALTAVTLFVIGAGLSLFSGRSAWWGGARMLLIGAAAGVLTYWIGSLMGASLA